MEHGKGKLEETAEQAREKAQQVGEAIKGQAKRGVEGGKQFGEQAREKAGEMGDMAKVVVQEGATKGHEIGEKGQHQARSLVEKAQEGIKVWADSTQYSCWAVVVCASGLV